MSSVRNAVLVACLFACGGCPLDYAADRTLTLHQMGTDESGTGPFTIDASRLPPGAIEKRVDDTGPGGNPVVTITVNPTYHVRVMLVPATQP